ncbi:MAG TPA: TIGR01212 family radical SAM protein [Lachnospiraceae bacterium]|nr:TIGR01212 family radical SAM protein [Lachnospiraceae bacterium]MEE3357844.1 TIGR01212 family radical SAM protein [Lachnospiraceae bacterium]HAN51381.1 TIGR01212 family radical SAM protein [Lachnospiraceae bacterium]
MEYRSLSTYWKEKFGGKVYKLSLQSGCTCPNRDGSIGRGGCIFCSEGGSGDFAAHYAPIQEQITEARKRVDHKFPKGAQPMYMAYFQSYTNTYGNVDRLRSLYLETIQLPEIVGISIGTRPDCLPIEILEMLSELNQIKPVTVELGLQTVHKSSADYIRRGYDLEVFEKAYQDLSNRGIEVVVHVILGLPGESREDMLETIDYLARLQPTLPGIKLQLLHILEGTQLAEDYRRNPFPVFTMEEYTNLVVECLKHLPKETVVHRLTGDGPKSLLIEPKWSGDKKKVLNLLQKKITAAPG